MATKKNLRMFLILAACVPSCVIASDGEVATERSPSKHHFNSDRPAHYSHSLPSLSLFSTKPPVNYQTLNLRGQLTAEELKPLKEPIYKEINLTKVIEVYEDGEKYAERGPLTISPDTFNPAVEVLSLQLCQLRDDNLQDLPRFKSLREVSLIGNLLTGDSIPYIVQVTSIEKLSLKWNKLDNRVVQLLDMPNLTELDISQNEAITSEIVDTLLRASSKLKKLNVRFTGMSTDDQFRIEDQFKK